jgi:hypothetical protein|nr:MAG TPA: hypothetical protein [Caudoviricetes sp.]
MVQGYVKMEKTGQRRGFGMQARDWTAIENEYVTGEISLQKLSEKYEIPLRTIKDRSRKGEWSRKKKEFCADTAQKARQKIMKKEAARLEKLKGVAEELADIISRDVEQLKEQHGKSKTLTESDVKMIKELTVALKNIADVMRDVYGLPTIREKVLLEKHKEWRKSIKDAEKVTGGVIFLPEVLEVVEDADHLDATAETD